MANSGLKKVTKLRKYINGRPTDEVKDNTANTEGFIPDVISKESCPVGCDAVVSGNTVVKGTTSTTTTTTIAVTPEPNLVKEYNIAAPSSVGSTDSSTIEYVDEYGETQELNVNPSTDPCYEYTITNDGDPLGDDSYTYLKCNGENVSGSVTYGDQITVCAKSFSHQGSELTLNNTLVPCATVVSKIKPKKSTGDSVIVEPTGNVFLGTTTTTTVAVIQTKDYTIDTSSATENVVIQVQQAGSSETTETEIKPGNVVKISSDTEPTIVTGDTNTTITDEGTVTPQQDTYTVTNNDYYNATTVEYRPYLGLTDEIELAPRETVDIKSQDTPTVSDGSTNVTVTAAGSPTQDAEPATIAERICDQHFLTNDSDFTATFSYTDCNQEAQEVTIEPGEETTVAAIAEPVLTSESAANVGTAFSVESIESDTGTTGTATAVTTSTTTTTTSTTTTTTAAPIVSVQDLNCDDTYSVDKPEGVIWYPETIKVYVGPKIGDLKFISFDSGFEGNLYKVYEGSTLLLDRAFITDNFQQRFMRQMYDALIDQGMSALQATDYAYGSKRVEPEKDFTQTNVRGTNYKTELTITKTTYDDYITVEVYKPVPKGNWVTFKIECI